MRIFLIIFFFLFQNFANASIVSKIINSFESIENLKFNFVQKIEGKIENGECIIVYPKKIYCKYIDFFNKILVSNGKSLVINSDKNNQYYRYNIEKTPLNVILDKSFILKKISTSKNLIELKKSYSLEFEHNENYINVFLIKKTIIC